MSCALGGLESSLVLVCNDGIIHPEYNGKNAKRYFSFLNLSFFSSL